MDPVSVIVAALVAGIAAGGQGAAEKAVKDAYGALRARLTRLGAEPELQELEAAGPVAADELGASVAANRLGATLRTLSAEDLAATREDAERLDARVRATGGTQPTTVFENNVGVQQGDHNTMTFTYPGPPGPSSS